MQQLEDALNIGLCGHFLIMLATMCFAAFSVVAVKYKKFCKIIQSLTLKYNPLMCSAVHVHKPAASIIGVSVIFKVKLCGGTSKIGNV
jgi:hypothetical protein